MSSFPGMRKLRITANDTKSLATKYSQAHFLFMVTPNGLPLTVARVSHDKYLEHVYNIVRKNPPWLSQICGDSHGGLSFPLSNAVFLVEFFSKFLALGSCFYFIVPANLK